MRHNSRQGITLLLRIDVCRSFPNGHQHTQKCSLCSDLAMKSESSSLEHMQRERLHTVHHLPIWDTFEFPPCSFAWAATALIFLNAKPGMALEKIRASNLVSTRRARQSHTPSKQGLFVGHKGSTMALSHQQWNFVQRLNGFG